MLFEAEVVLRLKDNFWCGLAAYLELHKEKKLQGELNQRRVKTFDLLLSYFEFRGLVAKQGPITHKVATDSSKLVELLFKHTVCSTQLFDV